MTNSSSRAKRCSCDVPVADSAARVRPGVRHRARAPSAPRCGPGGCWITICTTRWDAREKYSSPKLECTKTRRPFRRARVHARCLHRAARRARVHHERQEDDGRDGGDGEEVQPVQSTTPARRGRSTMTVWCRSDADDAAPSHHLRSRLPLTLVRLLPLPLASNQTTPASFQGQGKTLGTKADDDARKAARLAALEAAQKRGPRGGSSGGSSGASGSRARPDPAPSTQADEMRARSSPSARNAAPPPRPSARRARRRRRGRSRPPPPNPSETPFAESPPLRRPSSDPWTHPPPPQQRHLRPDQPQIPPRAPRKREDRRRRRVRRRRRASRSSKPSGSESSSSPRTTRRGRTRDAPSYPRTRTWTPREAPRVD